MKIEKVNLTKENLLKIKKIDDLFYTKDKLEFEWYLQRYKESHYAYFLIDDNSDVVGYMVSVPIKRELYDTIVNGVLINDLNINPRMYVTESEYNYIVSCVINEEYRYKNYGKRLLENLLKDLNGYICCLTISKDGYNLISKYMDLKLNINEIVSVFVKKY